LGSRRKNKMARYDLTAPTTYSEAAQVLENFMDNNSNIISPDLFEQLSEVCEEIDKVALNMETEINELRSEKEELENELEELKDGNS
jgi:vacuolar-type H+-ATPase subunit I/STV1